MRSRIATVGLVGTLGLCAVASQAAAPEKPDALRTHIEAMLEHGFQVGRTGLQAARRHGAAARRTAPDDPCVPFAWGLVLLRQSRHEEALAQFRTAGGGTWEVPAARGRIWCQLALEDHAAAFDSMESLAGRLATAGGEDARGAARWVGQVVAALDRTADSDELRSRVAGRDERLAGLLGRELAAAYAEGKDEARRRHEEAIAAKEDARNLPGLPRGSSGREADALRGQPRGALDDQPRPAAEADRAVDPFR